MVALAARDAERVLRFVADAEDIGGDDPFVPEVLRELTNVVPADWIGYLERDYVDNRCFVGHDYPPYDEVYGGWDAVSEVESDVWLEFPLLRRHLAGDFGAAKLSDLPRRAFRRTRYYRLVLEPLGVTDALDVAIPSPNWHLKRFSLDRCTSDFSARDRLVLDALQPHFARLWRTAELRRRLRAAIAGLEQASEHDPRGVVLLTVDQRIEFASPPAHRLLREHFGASRGAKLPPPLVDWLEAGAGTLERRLGDRVLTVERSGDSLLLEETRDELPLTTRERQILALVARGKTNREIAQSLSIAPTTVRKHLENIYAKLGVRTRTAAATCLLGILDDEARRPAPA